MKLFKIASITVLSLIVSATAVLAQSSVTAPNVEAAGKESFTDEQLTKFVKVGQAMEEVQKESQAKIVAMAQEQGLNEETLQSMGAKQMQGGDLSEYTEEQQAAYQKVQAEAMKMQQGIMSKVAAITEKEGLDMGTFRQIAMASQSDEAVKKRLEAISEKMTAE
jgi:hypothetical protein